MASTVSQIIEDIRSFRPIDIKFIQRCINDFLADITQYHKHGLFPPNHYTFRAGQNLPDKEFRYLRTVIVTAAVHWGFNSKLRIAPNSSF